MNGSGTSYVIRRRLAGEARFSVIGIAGKKVFVDKTIPGGVAQVEYTVEGQRSNLTGPLSEILTVSFGRENLQTSDAPLVDAIVNSRPMANALCATRRQ